MQILACGHYKLDRLHTRCGSLNSYRNQLGNSVPYWNVLLACCIVKFAHGPMVCCNPYSYFVYNFQASGFPVNNLG